jgi:antitoxin component of MazEF toxin-antitoxin module
MSESARNKIGVKPGQSVSITIGNQRLVREVSRIPAELLEICSRRGCGDILDGTVILPTSVLQALGIEPGDFVDVKPVVSLEHPSTRSRLVSRLKLSAGKIKALK